MDIENPSGLNDYSYRGKTYRGKRMLIHTKNFNIAQIADSGQCFRMNKLAKDHYYLIAFGRYLEMIQREEETVEFLCSEEDFNGLWRNYFDLDYDYPRLVDALRTGVDPFLRAAAEYGHGIRILKQDFFEAMISFIISQNKNIPAIKSCIESLCCRYGTPIPMNKEENTVYYTFPSPQRLAQASKEELRELKVGYRDEYIRKASQAVAEGILDVRLLPTLSYEEALQALKKIPGIGDKVANCICLYGLHHIHVFPVDVWIKRILTEVYDNKFDPKVYEGEAGIIQQYMFYYMRNQK